ncbi:hypothetical protein JFL43_09395 [Viridibacillus sp. YIM B01967]|uniref:Transposase n=1 Tax=Viridibacillus soli TaxID=2798301 RepID=A0ABS1H6N3_9BACL|nr:hypothetical protein [Viridibacillus soli]MBK3495070.1 hypothetical protein [Viridibacillus soli]
MNSRSINKLLNLPELNVTQFHQKDEGYFIQVEPVDRLQVCPVCSSHQTIRLSCTACHASFVWQYACAKPKKRYTKAFETTLPAHVVGATIIQAARVTKTPASTVERVFKIWLNDECVRIQKMCQQQAQSSRKMVLGIDDFAIRKGH